MDSQLRSLVAESQQQLASSFKRGGLQFSEAGMPGASQRGLPSTSISHELLLRSLNSILEQPPHTRHNAGQSSFSLQSDTCPAATYDSVRGRAHCEMRNRSGLNPSHVHRSYAGQPSLAALMQLRASFMPGGCADSFAASVSNTTSPHGDVNDARPRAHTVETAQVRGNKALMGMSVKCSLETTQAGTWRPITCNTSGPAGVATGPVTSTGLPCTPACGQTVVATPAEVPRCCFSVSDQQLHLAPEVQGVTGAGEAVREGRTAQQTGAAAFLRCPVDSQADGAMSMHATKHDCCMLKSAQGRQGKTLHGQQARDEVICSDVATQPLAENSSSAAVHSHSIEQGNSAKLDQPAQSTTCRQVAAEGTRQVQPVRNADAQALAVQRDPSTSARRFRMSEPGSAAGEGACEQSAVEHSAAERSPAQARVLESCAPEKTVAAPSAVEKSAVMQSAVERSGTKQGAAEQSVVQEPAVHTQTKPKDTAITHEPTPSVATGDVLLQKCDGHALCDGAANQKPDVLVDDVQYSAEQGNGEACTTRVSCGHHVMLHPASNVEAVRGQVGQAAAQRSVSVLHAGDPMLHGCSVDAVDADEHGDEAVNFKRYRLNQVLILPVKRHRRSSRSGAAPADGVKGPPRMGGFAKRLRASTKFPASMVLGILP